MSRLKKGDSVKWLSGDKEEYKIMATKEEPHVTENGEKIEVLEGNDFIIAKKHKEDGAFGAFQHVPLQHLEFII